MNKDFAKRLAARFFELGFSVYEVRTWAATYGERCWKRSRALFKQSNADAYTGGPGGEWYRVLEYFHDGSWDFSDDEFYPVNHTLVREAHRLYKAQYDRYVVMDEFNRLRQTQP